MASFYSCKGRLEKMIEVAQDTLFKLDEKKSKTIAQTLRDSLDAAKACRKDHGAVDVALPNEDDAKTLLEKELVLRVEKSLLQKVDARDKSTLIHEVRQWVNDVRAQGLAEKAALQPATFRFAYDILTKRLT